METTTDQQDVSVWQVGASHRPTPTEPITLDDLIALGPQSHDDNDDVPFDGRTMRRTRNREAVVKSLLDLIRAGNLEPSVAQIADRAEVSHRSVFRYFTDLNDLVRTAFDHVVQISIPLATIDNVGEGALEERVHSVADARLRVYDNSYQLGRVARLRAPAIPAIDESLLIIATLQRNQLRLHFAPEIAEFETEKTEVVLDTAMILLGFESYDVQRRALGSSRERIHLVWTNALLALFA